MKNKKIAVIAGTPVDTQMGVDFLKSKGLDAFSYPVSQNPRKQLLFQTLPTEERKDSILKLISRIKDDGMDAIFVYCNSLSATIDFHELATLANIYIVTPLDVYEFLANKYNHLGLICANNQATGGIEKIIVNVNPKCTVVGLGSMTLVDNVEAKKHPIKIIQDNHLEDVLEFFEGINVEALILGCTHFPYFEEELKSLTILNVINPAEKMYDFLCDNLSR
ncbi:MAG: Asp/Glu/hydantoin racemase [Intestinibacter bartlettii]|uniref:Asp/Glu/hydantoin racemase n=1 Tax=Intestinibacter bartlettii TaxID=261299 RepID=UPI0026EDC7DB|nr:Asp/Glu/hydantoin racemase [Intestinibacter bartlettii]MDO5009696.1 Asp/Glu/hydantoin racemase [Intestinibacter bartlettii]